MRKHIDLILLALALSAAWYQWHSHKDKIASALAIAHARMFPCSSPITYSIGSIDPGYTISREDLQDALREAESAWENQAKRNLFEYKQSSGAVTVNLVYDYRQASLDKLKAIGIVTDQSLESYKELKTRYEALAARVDVEQARLDAIMGRYKQREAAYNARVSRMNRRGHATKGQVRNINNARNALSMQFGGIKKIEEAVNSDIDTINALGTTLNQLIVQLNINVEQYNRAGSSIGRYEEGLYRIHDGRQTIDVYKDTDHPQLVSLLAHEMGHALGMDHVTGSESLMYPVNNGRALKLTANDIKELDRVCKLSPD